MSDFLYKTIAGERPQGKPNVFFSCHPDDFARFFEQYASKILKIQNCAVWYESEPGAEYDPEDLELRLSQMQLFVIPVTTKLLTTPNRAMDVEFPFAMEKHIPVLPLMTEQGLDDVYSRRFGDLQYLDPNNTDETRRSFDEVLSSYIRATLVSSELAAKVRAAFDAYIFLSYRKKDRKMAQELMRLIHKNPVCRDIAIWYDEFLTPGEDFNRAIEEMLEKSDLFALAVTPNLVNEVNYIMTTEYPAALAQKKPVLPVEMAETDRAALEEHYECLPPVVPGEDGEAFRSALLEKLKAIAVTANDADPGHNYLIGLAYLDGIDVEVNAERALDLITGAAEAGVTEAMSQLVTMYETGKGVARDYRKGIEWREKHVEVLQEAYEKDSTEQNAESLLSELRLLGEAQFDVRDLEAARKTFNEMSYLAEDLVYGGNDRFLRDLSVSYYKRGETAQAENDLLRAEHEYKKALDISEKIVAESGTVLSRRELANCYIRLGEIAWHEDFSKGKDFYEKALRIYENLFQESAAMEELNNMSACYDRLGSVALLNEGLPAAESFYKKALAIREQLAEETGTVLSRRTLSVSYMLLGYIAEKGGDLSGAEEFFKRAFSIREQLVEETGTVQARHDIAATLNHLGNIAKESGNLSAAEDRYRQSLAVSEKLAEESKAIEAYRDMSASYESLGDMARENADLQEAYRCYERCRSAKSELVYYTGTDDARREEADIDLKLGSVELSSGRLSSARSHYEHCLFRREKLAKETGTVESYRDLAQVCIGLGTVYHMENTFDSPLLAARSKELFERAVSLGENSEDSILRERARLAKSFLDK